MEEIKNILGELVLFLGMEQKVDKHKNKNKRASALVSLYMSMQITSIYMNLNLLLMDFVVTCLFVIKSKILIIFTF